MQWLRQDDQPGYSQEIAEAICEEMATMDHSLRRICDAEAYAVAVNRVPVAGPHFRVRCHARPGGCMGSVGCMGSELKQITHTDKKARLAKPTIFHSDRAGRASPGVERTGGTGVAVYHVRALFGTFCALRVAFSTRGRTYGRR
jgi:hypothetical protein